MQCLGPCLLLGRYTDDSEHYKAMFAVWLLSINTGRYDSLVYQVLLAFLCVLSVLRFYLPNRFSRLQMAFLATLHCSSSYMACTVPLSERTPFSLWPSCCRLSFFPVMLVLNSAPLPSSLASCALHEP